MSNNLYMDSKNKKCSPLLAMLLNGLALGAVLVCSSGQAAAMDLGSEEKEAEKSANVLSVEGGGTRAIMPLVFLSKVEEEAERQTGKPTPVCKIFDLMAGSSIGGTVVAGLTLPSKIDHNQPMFTATQMLQNFENEVPNLFQSQCSLWGLLGPKYKSSGPLDVAERTFGDATFDKSLTRTMIPAFNLESNQTVIFKSWKPARSCFHTGDIVQGTGAAPTYFSPYEMSATNGSVEYRLVDGGVSANVPDQSAMIEAEKIFGCNPKHLLVSLGTGEIAKSYDEKTYRKAGIITWALSLKDLFLDGQRSLSDYSMKYQYGDRYSRWSPTITIANAAIDNYAPDALQYYKKATLDMINKDGGNDFKALVTRLLKNRGLLSK